MTMRQRWYPLLAAAGLAVMAAQAAAQRPVTVSGVKQLDTGMRMCEQESAFEVMLRDGVRPILEIKVMLKPAPDTASAEEIPLRIELLDDAGQVVELADSLDATVSIDPPWIRVQGSSDSRYRLELANRRPKGGRMGMPRYRLRVSVDSSKTSAKESRTFLLFWPELGEQVCKRISSGEGGQR
jgi:hypothetical protein